MRRAAQACALALAALVVWTRPAAAIDVCTLPSVEAVVFAGYDPIGGGAVDTTGSVTYHCTGAPETITISLSRGGGASWFPRALTSGAHALGYNLFLDAARTAVWGDGTGGTSVWQETATIDQNTTLTVFGRIPAGQNPHVGSYGDSIVVTISY
ncbi:MAG: spore coat protein U domain-containing protein [Deltaproteobacteria bacterium]|nr:spore coat protein U domain-containing protein [Deltaproteobacteria bacterium]